MATTVTLSVVIPVFNEAGSLPELLRRLGQVLDRLELSAEILCIDDGSRDDTLVRLKAMRVLEPRLKVISFSRNFGKELALTAGLRYARGRAVVLMDGDLQHPPELIATFVAKWREGYQVVYGQRTSRTTDSPMRRQLSRGFYRAFSALSRMPLPADAGDFRLLDRRVVEVLNAIPERTRFGKGLYAWVGFRQIGVPYEVEERHAGRSAWSLLGLWRYALDGVTAFSTVPLRIWSYVGGLISLAALAYAAFFTLSTLLFGKDVPGYPSLIVAVMFFSGVQLIGLGVIGEYVGRIFTEVKRRPLYIVAEEVGFAPAEADASSEAILAPRQEPGSATVPHAADG